MVRAQASKGRSRRAILRCPRAVLRSWSLATPQTMGAYFLSCTGNLVPLTLHQARVVGLLLVPMARGGWDSADWGLVGLW